MDTFAHLRLVTKKTGLAILSGGGGISSRSKANSADRQGHSIKLQRWVTGLKSSWERDFEDREEKGLAPIDKDIVPIYLQLNPDVVLPTFDLESFGIEVISEENDGFIIGASMDNFRTLESKIAGFIQGKYSTGKVADFWQIITGNRENWRAEHILSDSLFAKWGNIKDDDQFKVEISIAFAKPLKAKPDPTKTGGEARLKNFEKLQEERDDALLERQSNFERFISTYGQLISSIVELEDSFGAQVEISGKGLKDLVVNYPFVFEVAEIEETFLEDTSGQEADAEELEILSPTPGAPIVGIIDSGIMEGHKYLTQVIDPGRSVSYLEHDPSTADHVVGGGHGTKVAGAVIFPLGPSSITGQYSPPCYIRNLRVLDAGNNLQDRYPAALMQRIVHENEDCKLYNLSISSKTPFRLKHMSSWAAVIDKLSHENDVLFIMSVGNVPFTSIGTYLRRGENYPTYLENAFCRITNPSHSSFGIAVGSIDHIDFEDINWKTVAEKDSVSGYSRIGPGIWGHIKPDLVEYGGGIVVSKNGVSQVKAHLDTSTELIHSTLHGGSAIGRTSVGTSFSTPKVTHIAAVLKRLYPEENSNLIRALLVQGARLPGSLLYNPTLDGIKKLGYGLPSLDRVTQNTDYRVTFYNTSTIEASAAHLYSLRIPESIRNPGNEFEVLIEVTLSFTAKIRRTRQRLKSYLGTWLDWTCSKLDDTFDAFSERALKPEDGQAISTEENESDQVIQWKIRERSDWGAVRGINRNQSSLQKDWVILKSYQLPEELSFAIRGHKGWDKNFESIPYAFTVSIEVIGSEIPIYEEIKVENQIEIDTEIKI